MRCFCSTLHYSYQCILFLKGWSEIPEGQMAGTSDAFQTPGVCLFLLSNLHIWKKYFINNTLQSHLLCLNIMLWQAVSNRLSFGKVTQEWRDALICARFTSWGLQRRKSSSYSGYSPCSLANFPVPEASFGVFLSSNHFSSSRIW